MSAELGGLVCVLCAVGWMFVLALRFGTRSFGRRHAYGKPPDLYAAQSDAALCQLFDATTAARLQEVPRLAIAPFAGGDPRAKLAGKGFARLLQRDMALVSGLSVHDPHVRASLPAYAGPSEVDAALARDTWVVGGNLTLEATCGVLEVWATRGAERLECASIQASDPDALLFALVEHLTGAFGGELAAAARPNIAAGHPSRLDDVVRLGGVIERAEQRGAVGPALGTDLEIEARALDLLVDEPKLSVLADFMGEDRLGELLLTYARDPHNVSLCFQLFTRLWRGRGYQREAFQFLRRALEIAPTHGLSNVLAAHAARHPERMGHHSELGRWLLPRSAFAVSEHARWLASHAADQAKVLDLARAGIDLDPADPASYRLLMDAYAARADFARALEVGRELLALFEPLAPHTRDCLLRDPALRERIERGEYDPAGELKTRMSQLEERRAQTARGHA